MTADIVTLPLPITTNTIEIIPPFPECWDSTIRAAFANCSRKGYWEFIRKRRKAGGNIHLIFGGCFAKAMEVARKSFYVRGLSPNQSILEATIVATNMWEEAEGDEFVMHKGSGANKTYPALVDAISSYFERWPLGDDEVVPLQLPNGDLFIEKTFAIPIDGTSHPTTGKPIIYAGRLDMLGQWKDTDLIIGVDEKTSGYLGDSWAANWPLRSQISGYCITDDHEVLTPSGWTSIRNITTNDLVAQWNEDGTFTFVNPTQVHCLDYKGNLYNFEGKVSISATEGHRQVVYDKRAKMHKTFHIESIPGNTHLYFITSGQAAFGKTHWPHQLLQLLVAVQADGYFTKDGAIEFCFTKQRKIDRLVDLIKNCDIDAYSCNENRHHTQIRIFTKNPEVELFKTLLSKGKKWGNWLLEFDNESLRSIIEETVFWDSHKQPGKPGWKYSTSVRENAEWISTLACLTGFTSSIRKVDFSNWTNKSDNWSDAYQVYISPRPTNMVSKTEKSILNYEGEVYCITVPSSYFLVRRNGRHIVTGNCFGASAYGYKIRNFHIRGIGILKADITFAENLQNRADWQIKGWLRQIRNDINRASDMYIRMRDEQERNGFDGKGMEHHWDQNLDSVCSSYGGCPYMDLCTSEHPERWLNNYDVVDWDPLASRD